MLQFLLTVGTIVLGLFVASRVLGIEAGEGGSRSRGKKGGGGWGSGRCVVASRLIGHLVHAQGKLQFWKICSKCTTAILLGIPPPVVGLATVNEYRLYSSVWDGTSKAPNLPDDRPTWVRGMGCNCSMN